MARIASFSVDHDRLKPGLYISRVDGDCVTYDVRMKKPNGGDYIYPSAIHTIEHILATQLRNSSIGSRVIYVGPMGCRTGMYVIVRNIPKEEVLRTLRWAFAEMACYSDIPGSTSKECGNYLEHDLKEAKREAALYSKVLERCNENTFNYEGEEVKHEN